MRKEYKDELNQLLGEAFTAIKNREKGALYEAVRILDPDNHQNICETFSIKPDSSREADSQILDEISIVNGKIDQVDEIWSKVGRLIHMPFDSFKEFFYQVFDPSRLASIGIVVLALILIAAYSITSKKRTRARQPSPDLRKYPPEPVLKRDTNLLLVVPSDRISSDVFSQLIQEYRVNSHDVLDLIDKSVYFTACEKRDVDRFESGLNGREPEARDYSEKNDIYLNLQIPQGENMIGQDLKRALCRNFPDGTDATVQEVLVLNDLKNVSRFIRA